MASDSGQADRSVCAICRLPASLCICSLVPRLETHRTRLVLVVTSREANKPSNTGQLAARCLASSTVIRKEAGPLAAPFVHPGELPLVLFPAADAVPITQYARSSERIALLVPDGSWSQARTLQHRGPLRHHTCVTLPASLGASEYRLRAEPQPGGLATCEAIARALRLLEGDAGDAIAEAILGVFRVMVERTLWFRGKLRDHEVTGGVPAAALVDDPRGAATRASR